MIEARLLQRVLRLGVGRVADEILGDERLADRGAPVVGRLGEDRAQLRGCALVHLCVVVRERDGAVGLGEKEGLARRVI